jgi:hypothetical protein
MEISPMFFLANCIVFDLNGCNDWGVIEISLIDFCFSLKMSLPEAKLLQGE